MLVQVGLLVATLQLDVSLLIQAFDLGFCDAFMPSDVFEECESAAKHAAAKKVRGCQRLNVNICNSTAAGQSSCESALTVTLCLKYITHSSQFAAANYKPFSSQECADRQSQLRQPEGQ